MSAAVTLSLAQQPEHTLVADCIAADRFASLGAKQIAELPVVHGGRRATLGDFFKVRGEQRHDRRHGGRVRQGGRRSGPVSEARLARRARRDRAPGDVPVRVHLPAPAPPRAAALPARALRARRRGAADHGSLRALLRRPGRAGSGRAPPVGRAMNGAPLDLNERAWEIADSMAANAGALRVVARTLSGGARVIDAGIDAPGGYGAGLALAEICMGGVGDVAYAPVVIGDDTWPGVRVWTDHPAVSCMAYEYAGWAIQVGKSL